MYPYGFPIPIVQHPLLRTQCPVPTTHCPVPTTQCTKPSAYYRLLRTHCPVVQYPVPTIQCPVPTTQCPVPTTYYRLPTSHYSVLSAQCLRPSGRPPARLADRHVLSKVRQILHFFVATLLSHSMQVSTIEHANRQVDPVEEREVIGGLGVKGNARYGTEGDWLY